MAQTGFQRQIRRLQRGKHHAVVDDLFGFLAEILVGVLLHLLHDQFLIQGAAIHADADRFAVIDGDFADGGELFVAALSRADVAGIDAVFIESFRAFGILREQDVAVVMEVADDGYFAASSEQAFLDDRDSFRRFGNVHCPANDLTAGFGKFERLLECSLDVGGVGVGHGLDHDWCAAANLDVANLYAIRFVARVP